MGAPRVKDFEGGAEGFTCSRGEGRARECRIRVKPKSASLSLRSSKPPLLLDRSSGLSPRSSCDAVPRDEEEEPLRIGEVSVAFCEFIDEDEAVLSRAPCLAGPCLAAASIALRELATDPVTADNVLNERVW